MEEEEEVSEKSFSHTSSHFLLALLACLFILLFFPLCSLVLELLVALTLGPLLLRVGLHWRIFVIITSSSECAGVSAPELALSHVGAGESVSNLVRKGSDR